MRETFFMFYTIFLLLHFRTDAACLSPPLLHGIREMAHGEMMGREGLLLTSSRCR